MQKVFLSVVGWAFQLAEEEDRDQDERVWAHTSPV